jgi:hypothetical protein
VTVDLTLSGQLMREFMVVRTSRYSAVIGMTGQSREYGPYTDARRPWVGLSPENLPKLDIEVGAAVEVGHGRHRAR